MHANCGAGIARWRPGEVGVIDAVLDGDSGRCAGGPDRVVAADGVSNTEIAERTGVSRPTVMGWRSRYQASDGGLVDLPRPGRPRELDHGEIVSATLMPPPTKLGVTHWSSRLLAKHLGISFSAVAKAWREYGIQPWRSETFKFSTDPELVAKVTDVVGLYLAPPENAIVLCVDENPRFRLWTAPGPSRQCNRAGPSHAPMTNVHMAPPRCSLPSRSLRARSRDLPGPASPPGVPALPQARGTKLPQRATASGDGQLRRPQT